MCHEKIKNMDTVEWAEGVAPNVKHHNYTGDTAVSSIHTNQAWRRMSVTRDRTPQKEKCAFQIDDIGPFLNKDIFSSSPQNTLYSTHFSFAFLIKHNLKMSSNLFISPLRKSTVTCWQIIQRQDPRRGSWFIKIISIFQYAFVPEIITVHFQ